ncbi:hypothetical protein GWI33_013988 [Rhynchophorus ferrugineus]|uniref:Katanin p80 WD40 repeat-containing subunit B1 n=1 Tax=Rhynchophorus ferrugineus TaxID=354439 RepID=A0A834M7B1_RHYFE|nr:hypothetical protein GWI33_013988 [Rhynchophorus ferrugineus]
MASLNKRSWKLHDLEAHNANVNCVALGHKSGRVMVTGGDDKKVNLWAVGKQSCFMSLSGHTTPIECVQFNQVEELVCAGSRAGALKVWDLEAAKLVRTLNGHRNAIKCVDFYPYGDILGSGSGDASIRVWDARKKGVICTYNGHQGTVNSIKFSPDGQWVASGGEDCTVKIWDLRSGRVLKEFSDHQRAVTCLEFHPQEFLLASGSVDRSVHFFDLEHFSLVSTESDLGPVRSLCFHPDGESIFAGVKDYLKIIGWEPSRLHDSVPVSWGRVCDISIAQNQLIGASFHLTKVLVYVVDLKKCRPMGGIAVPESPDMDTSFSQHSTLRKSFSKAERPISLKSTNPDVKTIEENTSGTDPEEESLADITNVTDYNEIFRGKSIARTPPPEPEPFQEPERDLPEIPDTSAIYQDPSEPQVLSNVPIENFEALSLDESVNNYRNSEQIVSSPVQYSRSKSNLDQVYISRLAKQQDKDNNVSTVKVKPTMRFGYQRQTSVKEASERTRDKSLNSGIKHSSSEANITKGGYNSRNASRKNSFSKPTRNTSVPNVAPVKSSPRITVEKTSPPAEIFSSTKLSPDDFPVDENEFIPVYNDRPVGIQFDDFLPKNNDIPGLGQHLPEMSEAEGLGVLMRGHQPMVSIVNNRMRNLKLMFTQFRSKGMKGALETAVTMDDVSALVDILGVLNGKSSNWNLDICVIILPKLMELIQSKYEQYVTLGCDAIKLILKHFGPVIRSNINSPVGSFGVDIPREERYQKSVKCHELLSQLRTCISKKLSLPGRASLCFREVESLMALSLD